MRPLTATLTPAEVAELLELSPSVVDALIESGHVLCHVRGGEARVPLAQLEELFRERLIRIYAAEARPVAAPAPVVERVASSDLPKVAEEPLATPDSQPALRDSQLATPDSQPATPDSQPATPPAPPAQPREFLDQRRTQRYIPRRQVGGLFGDVRFTVMQLSTTGLRIRHKEPLVPGTEAKLTFALLKPARSVVLRMRVVWTSLASQGEERFSISGLRVIEHADRLERAVESLRVAHELQPERRVRDRRSDDAISTLLTGASDDEIALVTSAMQKFAADPVEASRWYSRGRFALSDEQVRRAAPEKPRDREEVLGIWEYLERQVELEKVAGVVAWTRGAN